MAEKTERTFIYTLARVLAAVLFHTICPVRYHDARILKDMQAPSIVIGNHLSAMDPFIVAYAVKKYEIRFIGKRELTGSKLLERVLNGLHMIPVTRGGTDMSAMRACMQVLKDGHVLGIFPEGTRHQPEMMHTVESGAAMIALRANVPVLPVYIHSKFRPFHVTHVYVGQLMETDDIKAQGLSSDTIQQLCERIRQVFYGMREKANS